MKKSKKYIAFLCPEKKSYSVHIPDLKCSTMSDNFNEAIKMAKECSELKVSDLKKLPKATKLENFKKETLKEWSIPKNSTPHLIKVKLPKDKKIKIVIKDYLLDNIDIRVKKLKTTRDKYFEKIVNKDILDSQKF